MTGATVTWRDWKGKTRRRWLPTKEAADAFRRSLPEYAPTAADYLSDILGELEAHRAVLEGIQAALDRLADSNIDVAVGEVRDSVDLISEDLAPLEPMAATLARLERRWPRPYKRRGPR